MTDDDGKAAMDLIHDVGKQLAAKQKCPNKDFLVKLLKVNIFHFFFFYYFYFLNFILCCNCCFCFMSLFTMKCGFIVS